MRSIEAKGEVARRPVPEAQILQEMAAELSLHRQVELSAAGRLTAAITEQVQASDAARPGRARILRLDQPALAEPADDSQRPDTLHAGPGRLQPAIDAVAARKPPAQRGRRVEDPQD